MTTPFPPVPTGRQHRLEAEFLVTTPMFLGDAHQQADSIRPPSVKGALRFWWRALQWPRLLAEEQGVAPSLRRLHQEEAELFGLAAGHEGGAGQSRVTLRVERADTATARPAAAPAVQYLLGQGLYHFREGVLRNAIAPGGRFTVVLVGRPGAKAPSQAQWASLEEALVAFGLLGCLGARARKGLGSVSLQALSGGTLKAPQTADDYQQVLGELLGKLPLDDAALPPFTAFSGLTRLDVSLKGKDPGALLEHLGNEMQLYRGFGRNDMVNGQKAEKNFADDHDEMLKVAKGRAPQSAPRRAVFGLPHNYYFSSDKVKLDISTQYSGDRRASPLFLHVHQLPDGACLATQLIMPAVFLPPGQSGLKVKPGGSRPETLPLGSGDIDWRVLHGLLDRYTTAHSLLTPTQSQPTEAQA